MTRVLIAADDSETSVVAARTARSLFGDSADYLVVNVAEGGMLPWGDDSMMWGYAYPMALPAAAGGPPLIVRHDVGSPRASDDDESDTPVAVAERQAERVADQAGLGGATTIGEAGEASQAILEAAERHDVDVIVVGSHERGWFSRLLTGSVSDAVTKHAPVPVLVVH